MSIILEKQYSPVYPASLKIGEYLIAISPAVLQSFKAIREEESAFFLVKLIEIVGTNRYLREMLEEEIEKEGEQEALVNRLREQFRTFQIPAL